ncbi:MAG: pentapeptide repeat-containing protein [Lutimaribacter sp.]
MQPTTTTLTLPFSPQAFYTLVLFVALVLGSGLVFALLHGPHHKRPSVIERVRSFFQLDQLPLGVVFLGVLLWVMLFTTLFIGLIYVITEAVRTPYPEGVDDRWNFRFALAKLTAITAVIGALIAFPFTVWRIRLTREQVKLTDTSLFNEKFSAAATGLAARKQVTQISQKGDSKTVLTEWADDLVSRAIAIEQLEGLAKERPAEAPRIARILSAYLAEVSRDHPAKQPPKGGDAGELKKWAKHLVPRSDMQKAAQTMGRIRTISGVALGDVVLDLRFCNLQGCDLKNLNYDKDMMQDARLQGAHMWGAQMQGAHLWDAQMLGADLSRTEFDAETDFHGADLSGAQIYSVDFSHTGISAKQLNSAFGDGSTTLPAGMARPAHWPQAELHYGDFLYEYNKWRKNPATYAPPAP